MTFEHILVALILIINLADGIYWIVLPYPNQRRKR